ncbi:MULTISPECIES: excalibur calcium-binding domain-containing protein [Microvirga]|uniref:excalibur calcium-binding domain-containing protein n=1 Tax=Microvirga TaxID=186650 RepID=UPI001CFD0161|nr:excalibur calcium-binding domain-containing protein [Microvirga lenta]MCB5174609.1 excalibur calcium-binding domain-containing protein [Microvirga lenta]
MKVLPEGWRVHRGRDPEAELRSLKRRFQAISGRFHRAEKLRRLYRWVRMAAFAAAVSFALTAVALSFSPWPLPTTLRHIAALPHCRAARAVDLAPAYRGEPGYWRHLDADGDGRSCEPWTLR